MKHGSGRRSVFLRPVAFVAVLVLSAALAWSQTGTGNIQGTVKDSTAGVVAKAAVTLLHTATNRIYKTETNNVGFYLVPSVELGDYELTVESAGMETWKAQLHLLAGQTAEVDVVLKIGSTTTTVQVTGDVTPLVTTTSSTLATVVEPERISQLPVDGRNINQVLFMTSPGAVQETHGVNGVLWVPRVYGLRNASELTQDGAPLLDKAWGTQPNRLPGMDTVAEFRAETNNSSAKFDRPGTFMMTTKSGTNEFHGSAFETARNSGLGVARARQDYYLKPPHLVRNEFGGSVGGPVIVPKLYNGKNKTFFFVSYEGFRLRQNTTGPNAVPTPAERNGDFSDLVDSSGRLYKLYDPLSVAKQPDGTYTKALFPGNQIPVSRESPLALHLNAITPLPTLPNVNPLISSNWYGPLLRNQNQFTFTTKVDERLSDRDQLAFRYTHSPSTLLTAGNALTNSPPTLDNKANLAADFGSNDSGVADWTHTFSPTLFSETLFTISRDFRGLEPGTGTEEITSTLGLPNPFHGIGFPRVDSDGFGYSFDSGVNPDQIWTWVYNINHNFTKVKGRHTLQFGVRLRLEKYHELEDQQVQQGEVGFSGTATSIIDPSAGNLFTPLPYSGHTAANFFLGMDGTYVNRFNRSAYPYSNWETSAFFQDDFKVTDRLTLNLGLRYEFINPVQVSDHSLVGFDVANDKVVLGTSLDQLAKLGAVLPSVVSAFEKLGVQYETNQQAGLPSSLVYANHKDFDPRFGLAYRITNGNRPLVVRGGYSIFQFGQPLRFFSGYGYSSVPQQGYLTVNNWSAETSPDGLSNYSLRASPSVIAGVNSANIINVADSTGIVPGSGGVYFMNPHFPDPRAQEWNVMFEKEIMANTALSFGYIGTHGSNLGTYYSFNDPTPPYIYYKTTGQQLPTGTYANVATNPYDSKVYGTMMEYENIGFSNTQSVKVELEHRFSKGYAYQLFYVMSNSLTAGGTSWYGDSILGTNQYLPGTVPQGLSARLRAASYGIDPGVPKHSVRYNWIVDLPVGRDKWIGSNMSSALNRVVGGWQLAGSGSVTSNYYRIPNSNWGPNNKVQVYGTKYPIQDCTSGQCYNGYLYWNGYISPSVLNQKDASGNCTGICGVPANYKPADQPLITYGQTAAPANMPAGTDLSSYWDSNTVWVPLKDGTTAETSYSPGLNPFQNLYILAPFSWNLNASLFKVIPIREKMSMRFNADFFNVFNRPGIPTQPGDNGVIDMNTSANTPRLLQLTMRLTW
jgi:hypothetical protein